MHASSGSHDRRRAHRLRGTACAGLNGNDDPGQIGPKTALRPNRLLPEDVRNRAGVEAEQLRQAGTAHRAIGAIGKAESSMNGRSANTRGTMMTSSASSSLTSPPPHRARDTTLATAYTASSKAAPAGARPDAVHYGGRYDHVGSNGKVSFRRAARMHHLCIGTEHHSKHCILIADEHTVTVVALHSGEILATYTSGVIGQKEWMGSRSGRVITG